MARPKQKQTPGKVLDPVNLEKPISLEQIEERLVKSLLSGTLALHILRSSRKPMSKLAEELLGIEIEVGRFVGEAMKLHSQNLRATKLRGSIANTLSFIPISTAPPSENQVISHTVKKSDQGTIKAKKKRSTNNK